MQTELIPYLTFDGQTKAAMEYYHTVFGGDLVMQTFAEANMADTEAVQGRIVHAQLKTEEITIMASDTHPTHSPAVVMGNSVNLSINGSDTERLTGYFQALANGGAVTMPLEKQFWGDTFGACVDKFGINWMVNISNA